MDLFKRTRLPAGVVVDSGEKVLGWGSGPAGVVVATDLALYVPAGYEPHRIVWHLIDKAVWRSPNLDVSLHAEVGAPLQTWRFELSEPGRLPGSVRERVTASVVTSTDVDVADGRVRIAARRTETGEIRWSVNSLDGADLANPDTRAYVADVIGQLSQTLGL